VSSGAQLRDGVLRALDGIALWDRETMDAVADHPVLRRLNGLFVTATVLGDGYLWGALALGLILFGSAVQRSHVLIALGITVVNITLFQLFKLLFARPRPTLVRATLWARVADSYAFPSGHATIAFGIAWLVAVFYPQLYFQLPTFLGAITIAISRVYLREHYPLDVLGGALLGSVTSLYLLPVFATLLL
jgi:undecaprenyl-diphosphatase